MIVECEFFTFLWALSVMELWDFVFVVFWVFDVVPDLETVNFKVLSRNDQYEIREVEV